MWTATQRPSFEDRVASSASRFDRRQGPTFRKPKRTFAASQLLISRFRFGFGQCARSYFSDWKFEAFDGEEWRQLFYSRGPGASSGASHHGAYFRNSRPFVVFHVNRRDAFASSRFRLRLAGNAVQHMHVRGLEVFGTILPPWRL